MTRRIRLWIAAVLTAAGLMVSLAVAAHAGVGQAHPNVALYPTAVEYAVMLLGDVTVDDKKDGRRGDARRSSFTRSATAGCTRSGRSNDPSWSNSVPVNAVENVAEVLAEGSS